MRRLGTKRSASGRRAPTSKKKPLTRSGPRLGGLAIVYGLPILRSAAEIAGNDRQSRAPVRMGLRGPSRAAH